jgi:hypothetical protein
MTVVKSQTLHAIGSNVTFSPKRVSEEVNWKKIETFTFYLNGNFKTRRTFESNNKRRPGGGGTVNSEKISLISLGSFEIRHL